MPTKAKIRELAGEMYREAGPGSVEPAPPEWRRAERRRLIQRPVEISYRGSLVSGHVRNVSPDSMCVVTRQRLQSGSVINVRLAYADGAAWSQMTVIHCTETVGGYKVGLRSDDR